MRRTVRGGRVTGPLFRLGYITACCAFVYGLVLLADHAGIPIAIIVGVVGAVLALVLTEEWTPAASGERPRRARAPLPRRRTRPYTDGE